MCFAGITAEPLQCPNNLFNARPSIAARLLFRIKVGELGGALEDNAGANFLHREIATLFGYVSIFLFLDAELCAALLQLG